MSIYDYSPSTSIFSCYSYDQVKKIFWFEYQGETYSFECDTATAAVPVKNFRTEDGKLVARTYKSMKRKLSIADESGLAAEFCKMANYARDYLKKNEIQPVIHS